MIFRNYKADVTDAQGNFIFKGKTTKAIPVSISQAAREFDANLRAYLKRGYNASREHSGRTGFAIHFVMTVYRKLAASSVVAIHRALERRLERLRVSARADRVRAFAQVVLRAPLTQYDNVLYHTCLYK